MDSWAMVKHIPNTKQHLHPQRLTSVRAERPLRCLLDIHTCAILDNGDLKCWGRDNDGQLGDGGSNTNTNAPSSTPIDLGTGRTAVAVSAGYYAHLRHP
jgi:alpha-tubulin suppressor-like RCC1 family protein